jgi:hypothetical protein
VEVVGVLEVPATQAVQTATVVLAYPAVLRELQHIMQAAVEAHNQVPAAPVPAVTAARAEMPVS